jgi:predicted MFS family arabinose efflux permease
VTNREPVNRLPFATGACFGLAATMLTSFPIIAPYVVSELRLSYSETGLITAAYMFGYGVFQIPLSLLGLRIGSGRVLLGATLLMCASALIGVFSTGYAVWIVSRFLLGVGGAAVLPLSLHLLAGALEGDRLMRGIGIFVAGWGLGMTVALLGAAPILYVSGWRDVLLATVALGILVFILLARVLSTTRVQPTALAARIPSFVTLVPALTGNSRLNLMGLINAAGTTTMICVPSWLPLYLTGAFDAWPAAISAVLAALGLAVVLGGWSGGALAIRFGWRRVVVGSLAASAVLVGLIPLIPSLILVVGVAVLIGWVAMLFPAPIQSLFPTVVPPEWTALAAGYYNTLGFCGAFAASLVFGLLVDWSGSFAAGWAWLALVPWLGVAAGWMIQEQHSAPNTRWPARSQRGTN